MTKMKTCDLSNSVFFLFVQKEITEKYCFSKCFKIFVLTYKGKILCLLLFLYFTVNFFFLSSNQQKTGNAIQYRKIPLVLVNTHFKGIFI